MMIPLSATADAIPPLLFLLRRHPFGHPHEVDHWRDIAGYATLVERWLTSCTASGGGPTRRPAASNPATPAPSRVASVWPLTPEEEEERVAQLRG